MNPSASPPPADDDAAIAAAAERWFLRREEGFTAAEIAAFARWRRADPRHEAAWTRLETIHSLLGQLPFGADRLDDLRPAAPPAPNRRRWFRLAGAVAAGVAVAAVGWWQRPGPPPSAGEVRYTTAAGGYERVTLADGSVLELNADSVVRVAFAARERRVTLTAGEAHFTVMRDPARPFIVGAGTYAVRAVGTAFNVRFAPDGVEVLVTHGKVQVSPQAAGPVSSAEARPPLLGAGQRVVLAPGTAPAARDVETVAPDAIRQALSWQERKLLFSDTPLAEVVAQFNRRNRLQLVIDDEALGMRPVGGSFAADNVEAFVRLLETAGDIVAERQGAGEIVLRKAR